MRVGTAGSHQAAPCLALTAKRCLGLISVCLQAGAGHVDHGRSSRCGFRQPCVKCDSDVECVISAVSVGDDHTIRVWSLRDGDELCVVDGHDGEVSTCRHDVTCRVAILDRC